MEMSVASGMDDKSNPAIPGMPDFANMLSRMQLPGMPDMDSLLAAHRKNLETLTAANRIALEGAQAVARRNMEIMQQTMSEMSETVRSISTTETPQAKAAKQTELLKVSYERAVANLREISDLIQKSNSEAMGVINHRFTEAMDEVKALVAKKAE